MSEDEPSGWYADEVVRGFLGLFVVPASLVAIAAVWIATSDPARADSLSRWLQGAIIAVLAFYFGNGDAAAARRRARRAEEGRAEVSAELMGQVEKTTRMEERLILASAVIDQIRTKIEAGPDTRGER